MNQGSQVILWKAVMRGKNLSMAIVVRDSRVLIQRRYRMSSGMVHEFPGGAIEPLEDPVDAARRELEEETSIGVQTDVLAVHKESNELDGSIYFVVFEAPAICVPAATSEQRQQTFHWSKLCEIPLEEFHSADVRFIRGVLVEFIQ